MEFRRVLFRSGFGARRVGIRAYIAVSGGFLGDRWLGSMSTNLMSARGGVHGRGLVVGDTLAAGESMVAHESGRSLDAARRPHYGESALHAIPGAPASELA